MLALLGPDLEHSDKNRVRAYRLQVCGRNGIVMQSGQKVKLQE